MLQSDILQYYKNIWVQDKKCWIKKKKEMDKEMSLSSDI